MANQIQGLRPDGTLPSVARAEVEQIVANGSNLPDGVVPIFPTLAEALAWEAANPGRVALTLEGEGGGGPGPGPDPDPGVVVASDDFSHPDGYITGLPTPVGNRTWVQDVGREVIGWASSTGGHNAQPNVRDGRYVGGAGFFDTGLTSLRVSFDYRTVGTDSVHQREIHVSVGGYEFRIVNSLNLYRLFSPDGGAGKLVTSVNAGEEFVNEGHCVIEYDGLAATMSVNGEVVIDHVGDGRSDSRVGVMLNGVSGIGTADPGTAGTLTGNWIDNLTVESL